MASAAERNTGSPSGLSSAAIILGRQLKQMQSDKDIPGISCGLVDDNVFEWEVMLMLSDEQDSLYGGELENRRTTRGRVREQGDSRDLCDPCVVFEI